MKRLFPIILVVFFLTPVSCSLIPSETGSIKEQVSDVEDITPIHAANFGTEPPGSSVTTDEEGNYQIDGVDPGNYSVSAIKPGFVTATVRIAVTAGKITTADLHMSQDTTSVHP